MQKSYRIGIDARLYSQTGVGRYIRSLVSELAKIDRKNQYVLFINSSDEKKIPHYGGNFKKRVVDIRWHTLAEQLVFPTILYKENLDLIHFPYFSFPIAYFRPFVVTIHDLTPLTNATGKASTLALPLYYLKHRAYQIVLSTAVDRARCIIVPSKSTKQALKKYFPKAGGKTVVTYEGVRKIEERGEKKIIEGDYFLYVGNAYPHKNLERLIKAFLRLKKEVKLVFVGGNDFFYLKLRKTWGANKQILFFGQANDKQLANLYSNAVALVFPSLSEGFGLPAVEAMVYGCLVIASSIPSLKEICGEAAVYVDPLSIDSIVDKMNKALLEGKRYKENIKKGLGRTEGFSWRRMTEKTHQIYESCLGL